MQHYSVKYICPTKFERRHHSMEPLHLRLWKVIKSLFIIIIYDELLVILIVIMIDLVTDEN